MLIGIKVAKIKIARLSLIYHELFFIKLGLIYIYEFFLVFGFI